LERRGLIVWQSNVRGKKGTYHAHLQGDCNLLIWKGTPDNKQGRLWKTNRQDTSAKACFLGASAADDTVAIYRGTLEDYDDRTIWRDSIEFMDLAPSISPATTPSDSTLPTDEPTLMPTLGEPTEAPSFFVVLERGARLFQGEPVSVGRYRLVLNRKGNLELLYRNRRIWQTNTGDSEDDYFLALQGDCNMVLRRGTPSDRRGTLWKSKTSNPRNDGCFLGVRDERISIFRGTPSDFDGRSYWSDSIDPPSNESPTRSPTFAPTELYTTPSAAPPSLPPSLLIFGPSTSPDKLVLVLLEDRDNLLQEKPLQMENILLEVEQDGNLRLGVGATVLWETNIRGVPGDYFARLQGDCNLIVFRGNPESRQGVLWKSKSSHPDSDGCFLALDALRKDIAIIRGAARDMGEFRYWSEDLLM